MKKYEIRKIFLLKIKINIYILLVYKVKYNNMYSVFISTVSYIVFL